MELISSLIQFRKEPQYYLLVLFIFIRQISQIFSRSQIKQKSMSKRSHAKLRLVKCPRCAEILPEPEQVPVYACGGCDTILQAKYYRNDNNAKGSSLHQEDGVQTNGITISHALSEGESDGSSQRSSFADRQSLDHNEERDQSLVVNCNSKQMETVDSAHHILVSDEPSFLGNEENGETDDKTIQFDHRNCIADQNKGQLGAESPAKKASFTESPTVEDCNKKQIEDWDSAVESSTFQESQDLENTKSEQLGTVNGAKEDKDYQLKQYDDIAFDKHKQVGEANSSREASLLYESLVIQNKEQFKLAPGDKPVRVNDNKKEGDGFVERLNEKLEGIKLDEGPSPTEIIQGGDGYSIVILEIGESNNVSVSSSAEDMVTTEKAIFSDVSHLPRCESSSLDNVEQTLRQKVEDFGNSTGQGSENLKSTEAVNAVGNLLKVDPRSPTEGSLAYEESVSSFDGNDDQVPRKEEHVGEEILPGNNAVSGYVDVEESPEWNNEPLARKAYESQIKCSSTLLDEKLNRSILEGEESVEENQIPSRSRTVLNRHTFLPRTPPSYWSSEVAYETGSSSSFLHDELPSHPMHHHPYRHESPETWVRKTHTYRGGNVRRRSSETGWRENEFLTTYYGYETSGEIYQRAGYHDGYIDRRRRSESWSQNGSFPRMPYSGEAFNRRYQIPDPYMRRHHHLDSFRWSAQLPQTGVCCHQGLYIPPSMEISWDPYEPCPMNPQRLMEPEPYPWVHDMIILSDDQKYKDQIMKRLYLREKRQAVKRHLLPVAGGAPFITCYFCFTVLRLPGDFLLARQRRKRTHTLKCGACSKILEFSLDNECNFAAFMPNACEEAQTDVKNGNFVSEKAKVRGTDGRELLSDDSSRSSGREKSKSAPINEERREGSDHAARGSSVQGRQMTVSWQLPPQTKSPLHRLMGYSSPHDLLHGHDENVEK